jgi:hypothetical protein
MTGRRGSPVKPCHAVTTRVPGPDFHRNVVPTASGPLSEADLTESVGSYIAVQAPAFAAWARTG